MCQSLHWIERLFRFAAVLWAGIFLLLLGDAVFHPRSMAIERPFVLKEQRSVLALSSGREHTLYRHDLRGNVRGLDPLRQAVSIRSALGYCVPGEDGSFELRIPRSGEVIFLLDPIGTNPSVAGLPIDDLRVDRRPLPIFWVLLVLSAGLAAGLGHLSRRPLTSRRIQRCALLLFALLLSLAASEIALRVLRRGEQPWHLFPPNMNTRLTVYPDILPGVPAGTVAFRTNSEGIQGEERDRRGWDSVLSVLCVGASTTQCLYLDEESRWPRMLEKRLREEHRDAVWVGNAGRSGYPTESLVAVIENYLPRVKPDYVVLLTGFNEGIAPGQETRTWKTAGKNDSFSERIARSSEILRLAYRALVIGNSLSGHDVDQSRNNRWYLDERARLKQREDSSGLTDASWDGLDLTAFTGALDRILAVARKENVRLVLCTQPALYKNSMPDNEKRLLWMMGNYTPASKRRKMDKINESLRTFARSRQVPLVDLDRILPRSTDVFYDDCHFNVNGARLVADHVFRAIRDLVHETP